MSESPNKGLLLSVSEPKYVPMKNRIRANDAVMVPDRGFTKQLKALDPEYECVWDWGTTRWQIWRFPKDKNTEPYHVLTVDTDNRSYREVSTDILLKLRRGLVLGRMSLNQLVNYFDEMDNQILRRKQKEMYNKIHDITLETLNYQRGVPQVQVPRNLKVRRAIVNA